MKIAILGCGKQGAKHLRAFRRLPEIAAIALADLDPARAGSLAELHAVSSYAAPDAAFDDRDAAAIVIATPTATHGAFLRRALAAGKHVLCEKPLTDDPADVAAGPVGRIAYLYRFAPAIAEARRIVRDGELGTRFSARFHIAATGGQAPWKHRRAEGGGALNELAAHMIDLAGWMFGPVEDARLSEKKYRHTNRRIGGFAYRVDAEDYIMLRLRCRSAVVTIEADFAAPRFAQWLAIEGEHGTVHASIDPAYPSRRRVGGFERRLEGSDTDLYLAQARAFLDAVAAPDRPNPICTLREASATARILTSLA